MVSELKVHISVKMWAMYMLIPIWFVQKYFGFKVWTPKFLFKIN